MFKIFTDNGSDLPEDYAREHNEKAIWDIGNAENISTGGTGSNLPPQ